MDRLARHVAPLALIIALAPFSTPPASAQLVSRVRVSLLSPGTALQLNTSISASITATPGSNGTTVTWTSSNANSATLNGSKVALSGSTLMVVSKPSTATLYVANSAGTANAQTLVAVLPPTATPTPPPPPPPPPTPPPTPTPSTSAPHIFFTDINSGSGTGGDTGNGVYVRIFGSHFGASQSGSTVTLGGQLVTNCALCSWKDNQIVAQLGSAAKTGNILVSVAGSVSNGVPFTVTPTTILFVGTNGSDNNAGSFAQPFKTWRAAFNAATGNDNSNVAQNTVIYLLPGVSATTDDGRGYRAAASTDLAGTSAVNQLAIVGFPGGTATVGSTSVDNGFHGWGRFLTIADLKIVGASSAIDDEAGDVRIMNNDISCPSPVNGLGGTACVLGETDNPSASWVFQGNNVHDTGGSVDKTYHAIYFSTGVNHADVGWNSIGQNFKGYCRSIMFHATGGGNLSDIHVHDNVITGGYCDAIGLASVDPSLGPVEVFNNVISHVAIASNPYGVANEAAIAINSDPATSTSGTVQVYNNTVVDAGAYTFGHQNGCFGVVLTGAGINLTNNICSQPNSTQPYIEAGSQNVTGTNNLWFGAGAAPSWDSHPVTSDPAFVSPSVFALQSASPAKSAGSSSKVSLTDITGTGRTNPPSVGAFE